MTNGIIHWGQKRLIGTKQHAWVDIYTYEVPFSGRADASRMTVALSSGKYDKRPKPWTGACGSVSVEGIDQTAGTATIAVSMPIGD